MIALRRVLVAADFSEPSDAALAYGRELAHSFGAALTVVHVVEDLVASAYGVDSFVLIDAETQRQFEVEARRKLDAAISDHDRAELRATPVVLVSNSIASAIVHYARDCGTDLIVMGTRGRGGVAHLVMGSVAEHVVRTAPCPVLTVRHPEHEFVLPDALVAVARA